MTTPYYDSRGAASSYFNNPSAAPHESHQKHDVSPLHSYEQDSYLKSSDSRYEAHSVPYQPPKSPGYSDYNNPYDSRDDIPLQTQHPKGFPDSSNPNLEHQASDTWPLNPQAQQQPPPRDPNDRRARRKNDKSWAWANIPWVTYTLTVIQICVFIAELVKMSNLVGSPIQTKPSFNPMVGPSQFVLISMGARYVPCMRNQKGVQDNHIQSWPCPNSTEVTGPCSLTQLCGFENSNPVPNPSGNLSLTGPAVFQQKAPDQWFRFITPIFMHGGFIHILGNLLLQLLLGRDMEKIIGSIRFFVVYFAAGIFGFVLGANYAKPGIASTGCSGALFGIVGLVFIDLFYTWTTRRSPWWDLFFLVLTVAIEIVIGLLPTGLDNFSHIGGLVVGLALGVALLHSPTALRKHYDGAEPTLNINMTTRHERAKRQSRAIEMDDLVHGTQGAGLYTIVKDPAGWFRGRKPLWWLWLALRAALLITIVACFIALVHNFYNTTESNCVWCQKLSCINYKDWCKQGDFSTQNVTTSSLPGAPPPASTSPARGP